MNERRRPDNAPGANGLRGGTHTYSLKVQTGNWVEAYGGPADYKRGFSTVDFETEGQHAQKGATCKTPPEYGAGLPLAQHLTRKPPCCADSFSATEFVDTRSSMQITNAEFVALKEKNEEYKPKATITREQLEAYRKQWTTESEIGRKVRYITESRLAGNQANAKFQMSCIRFLPGTPKALENFRERLIEKFGVLGLAAMRCYVGLPLMTISELKERLSMSDVEIKGFEFNQTVAFITASTTHVSGADLLRVLKGNVAGFDAKVPKRIFSTLGPDTVTIDSLTGGLSDMIPYPEVLKGMSDFVVGYSSDGSTLTLEEFIEFSSDMYSASSDSYKVIFNEFI